MAKTIDSVHMSEQAGCVQCGEFFGDAAVKEIDQWIVEDDGVLICPGCKLETYAYG